MIIILWLRSFGIKANLERLVFKNFFVQGCPVNRCCICTSSLYGT